MNHSALFVYDAVNRLACAQATGNSTYNLAFSYKQDGSNGQLGNVSCVINTYTQGLCAQNNFNAANNQISGYAYDAAGNMTAGGGHTYQYDAESRLVSVDGGATDNHTHNALGQEVTLGAAGATCDHLYDPTGLWVGRWCTNYWPVSGVFHLGSQTFAIYIDQTYFIHENALGSTLMTSNSAGNVNGDALMYPWGQSWLGGTPEWHYAGFEYGDAAGLYPTLNRQYSNGLGRWLTSDPAGLGAVDPSDPQSWNMYAYVQNNPTTRTDPTGLCDVDNEHHNWLWCGAHALGLVETQAEQVQDARNFFNNNVVVDRNGNRVDPANLTNAQVLQAFKDFNTEWQETLLNGGETLSAAVPVMTSWGWSGSSPYKTAVKELESPGDHLDLNGKVPTRAEATEMIKESGGTVDRQDLAHGPGSVSTHDYPHINYTTEGGVKGTVKVQN